MRDTFRSVAYANKGDFTSAIADADSAIATYDFASGYANRAEIYLLKGDVKKAIADYTEAIKVEKKSIEKERKYQDVKPERLLTLFSKGVASIFATDLWTKPLRTL